jgi:hypothetical protein
MAKIVQHRRGTTSSLSTILGLAGEIFVDTSLVTIFVHDGVTTGGTRLARFNDIAVPATSSSLGTVRADGTSILVTSGVISVNPYLQTSSLTYGGFVGSSVGQTATIASFQTWVGNTSTLRLYGKRFNAASYDYGTASYNLQYNVDNVNYAGLEFNPQNYINGVAINVGLNGSSQAVIIDGSGRMLKPFTPAFLATAPGSTQTNAAGTVLNFGTLTNTFAGTNRNSYYNTSTYAFTAPVAGLYEFYVQLYLDVTVTQATKSFTWRKNGAQVSFGNDAAICAFYATTGLTIPGNQVFAGRVTFELAVGDYIQVGVRDGNANSVSWYGGHSVFGGFLIG